MKEKISQSYRKGKQTIKKKAEELATLCDIPVALMIVNPNGKKETWPESKTEVKAIVDMYKEKLRSLDCAAAAGKNDDVERTDQNKGNGLNSKIKAVDNRIGVLKKRKKNFEGPPPEKNKFPRFEKYDDELMELMNLKIAAIEKRIGVLKNMEREDGSIQGL